MSNFEVGLIVVGVVVVAAIAFLAWPNRKGDSNLKRVKMNLSGIGNVDVEAQDRPKGTASIKRVTSGGDVKAQNKAGGSAEVEDADALGSVTSDVSDETRPK
jgi:FtsZ-interacting cell division protein ZipA